jgi:hypothetical protein
VQLSLFHPTPTVRIPNRVMPSPVIADIADCPPRLATPRRRRPTYGFRAAAVSAALGRPVMPWQRRLFDVTLETDPAGALWYRTVVVVVPRQQGKSTAMSALMVERGVTGADRTVVYTAQDRSIAAERVIEQLHDRQLARSALRTFAKVRRTNGSERITFANGSRIIVTAPTDTAGHGLTLDLALIDEAWSQRDMSLPQAFLPAMVTRPEAQLWVVSTVGDGSDELLQFYQRAGVDSLEDPESRVCYLEWSAAPDDDADDPAVWAACMPALGHTVTLDTIRAQRASLPDVEFERAYLCRRPPAGGLERVIDHGDWAAACDPRAVLADPVVLAVEYTWDRAAATIAACGWAGGVRRAVEVVEHRPGTGWVLERVVELYRRWKPARIVIDTGGPAAPLHAELEARRYPVVTVSAREMAAACGAFYDDIVNGLTVHRGDIELDAAVAGAARRVLANAWAWERRSATVDISPLVAVTLARFGHAAGPSEPVIRSR